MTRRLRNSRADQPEPAELEGYPTLALEGDLLDAGADAIGSLRPFGRDIPEQRLDAPSDAAARDGAAGLSHAATLAERGRRLEAIQALRQLVRQPEAALDARLMLAELLQDANELDEALEVLSEARAAEPGNAGVRVRRGALYARMGRPREAEEDFREALEIDASHFVACRYLGVTRLRLGAAADAERVLREALSLAPQDAETVIYLGEAVLVQGDLEAAHGLLARGIEMAPGDPRGYTLLGRLYDRQGRTDEAMAMYRKSREVSSA